MSEPRHTLLSLTHDFDELERELLERGGEADDALLARMQALTADLSSKVDRTVFYLGGLRSRAEALKAWAKRASAQAALLEAHHDRFLRYLDLALGQHKRLDGEACSIARRDNPVSVEVTDVEALRETCPHVLSTRTEEVVDKQALRAALLSSENIRGAQLKKSHRIEVKP